MIHIPDTIQIYLNEIADRLSQGRATVMVGAGFSKNAIKIKNTDKQFLSWNELGDLFYEKLNGKKPDEQTGHYMDALRLAGNIECTLGRSTLDRMLLDYLPDDEYEPSDLHKELLKLNWKDIFTTNYDTLLERTRKYISNRKYQVVVNKDDLVYLGCPRIIKLHGSFPSQRPFVISQEDYRKYPKDSAAFVNTVQQALLENIMCLIGFSGDDPNFLNWIGWIKDNLGESMSKIYLITVDLFPRLDNALLESRNIVIINMAECFSKDANQDIGNLYKDALSLFFTEISNCKQNREKKWNPESKSIKEIVKYFDEKTNSEKIKNDIEQCNRLWKECKMDYPGWIIMPFKFRRKFEASLEDFERYLEICYTIMESSDDNSFLEFLKVYDWVRQICLLPLTRKMVNLYEKGIHGKCNANNSLIDLELSIMEYYRCNGMFDKHSEIMDELEKVSYISNEQNAKIECERACVALYQFDFEMMEQMLDRPSDILNYDMELMYIGLMWECDRNKQGADRLSNTLDKIRCFDNSKMSIKSFSQEAYIINLFGIMTQMEDYTSNNSEDKDDFTIKAKRVFSNYESQCYGLGNRRDFLKIYECDPEREIELLDVALLSLKNAEIDEMTAYTKSVQFINYIERSGMCITNDTWNDYSKQIKIAVKNVIKKNLYWGIVLCVRMRDVRLIHDILTDEVVVTRPVLEVENIVGNLFSKLQEYCNNVNVSTRKTEIAHKYMVYESYIPHILSILIWYISKEKRQEIFQWMMLHATQISLLKDIKILIEELFASFNLEELKDNFCEILSFGIDSEVKELSQCIMKCSISLYSKHFFYPKDTLLSLKHLLFLKLNNVTDMEIFVSITYRIAILYHIGYLDETENKMLKESINKILQEGNVYSLDLYYFVADLVNEEKKNIKIIQEKVFAKLSDYAPNRVSNGNTMKLTEFYNILRKFEMVCKTYHLVWDKKAINLILLYLNQSNSGSVNFLFFRQILSYIICHSNLNEFERISVYKNQLEKYGLIFNKNPNDLNVNDSYFWMGLFGKNVTTIIETVDLFYILFNCETDIWISNVSQIIFILCMTIKSNLSLAAFCMDMIRKIIKVYDGVFQQVDVHIIVDLLKDILERPICSDEALLVKASAAKLSYDLSLLKWDDKFMIDIIQKWETECAKRDIPMLIKKQWYDIT